MLDALPPELLAVVLAHLPPRTLLACQLVARLWDGVVRGTPELVYRLELWRDGLLAGTGGGRTPAALLAELLHRRKAWRELTWKERHVVCMESPEQCRAYELGGGVFCLQETTGRFQVLRLGKNDAALETTELGIPMTGFEDFAFDVGQNLLAVLDVPPTTDVGSVVFRSLLDPTTPHADARLGKISFPCQRSDALFMSMQVLDDLVTIYLHSGARLLLFEWRTGEFAELNFGSSPVYRPLDGLDCHMLGPRLMLVACRRGRDGDEETWSGCLQVHSIDEFQPLVVKHVATLHLPLLSTGKCQLSSAAILVGPYIAQPAPGAAFYRANDRRIVTVVLRYSPGEWVRLVMHIRTIHRLVDAWKTDGQVQELDWDDWGPRETRMIKAGSMQNWWPRHINGECIALPTPAGRAMRLLDFNIPVHHNNTVTLPAVNDDHEIPDPGKLLDVISVTELPVVDPPTFTAEALHTGPSWCQVGILVTVPGEQGGYDESDSQSAEDESDSELFTSDDDPLPRSYPAPPSSPKPRDIVTGLFRQAVHTELPYREVVRTLRRRSNGERDDAIGTNSEDEDGESHYGLFMLDEQWVLAADVQNSHPEVVALRMG
ncbi:F-box domain-containing protein [Mycena indigotica]|uniref:F-box domain-containing protein n=1 Tax=Mycena indigotica TaxID=2126181 RepID=A0A8H6T3L8_9AGAR|nr:F-box domain-containing protein [Mycena indigotica]KAF7310245.1 F-box domain-containing protein [Mycena indigotica]